jgi:hypothetical protein
MAQKQIKQFTEETTPVAGDMYLMQKASNDETVKVDAENIIPDGAVTPDRRSGGFAVGTFTGPSSTGNYSVTGVGFTPKIVRFSIAGGTGGLGSGLNNTKAIGHGVMTANGNQHTFTFAVRANAGYQYTNRLTTRCIAGYVMDSSGNETLFFSASFVSMDGDGFTINVNNASTVAFIGWEAEA